MSLVIAGNATNVSTPLTATIVGMANNGSGKIRVQTSAPHLFATGDYVHVVTITTVINTYFSITVIDATHFDLDGSTFTGTGAGTATDASLTPQIQVPTDGDTFSLQLSGMLSSLQCLADRTQFLKKAITQRTMQFVAVTSSGNVIIPPWSTHMILFGCGGGGGGGGGPGGEHSARYGLQFAAGGGGAGAQLLTVAGLTLVSLGTTSLDVTIGLGGTGGSGSSGAVGLPGDANAGSHGNPSIVTYHDGFSAGGTIAKFYGGAGGGGGSPSRAVAIYNGNTFGFQDTTAPVFTPGGEVGPGGIFRNGASSKKSQYAPGHRQLYNIINLGAFTPNDGPPYGDNGNLRVAGDIPVGTFNDWGVHVYTDPIGQMGFGEGGASMATAGNPTYSAGVSYDGAPSNSVTAGGSAGTEGTAGVSAHTWLGGAAGGGGGGGAFGAGGAGGDGGNGSAASGATSGTAGQAAGIHSGAGGGGGGGGGNGSGNSGNGAAGGNGGGGTVWIFFLAAPAVP